MQKGPHSDRISCMSLEISRRGFIALSAKTLLVLPALNLESKPWSSRNWWPIFPETASKDRLPRLHDVGGPLHVHDVECARVYGVAGKAREWEENYANEIIRNYPETREWAGFCHAMAIAAILETEPIGSARFDRSTKEGILAARHAGDVMVYLEPQELADLLVDGGRAVVDLPEREGRWFRVAYGLSGQNVRVTNFGLPDKYLPFSKVVGAWQPYHDNVPLWVPVETRIETAGLANPELKEEVVNLIENS